MKTSKIKTFLINSSWEILFSNMSLKFWLISASSFYEKGSYIHKNSVVKLNTWKEIQYLRAPMYKYSLLFF